MWTYTIVYSRREIIEYLDHKDLRKLARLGTKYGIMKDLANYFKCDQLAYYADYEQPILICDSYRIAVTRDSSKNILGWSYCSINDNCVLDIGIGVYVKKKFRRMGIGSILVKELTKCKKHGHYAWTGSTAAFRFYKKLGID